VCDATHGPSIYLPLNGVSLAAQESTQGLPPNGEMGLLDSPRRLLGLCEGSTCEAHHEGLIRPRRDWANLATLGFLWCMEATR
jgi:hypothetical protein